LRDCREGRGTIQSPLKEKRKEKDDEKEVGSRGEYQEVLGTL